MRHHGIRAIMARPRWVRTTDSRHDLPIAANLLKRNFPPLHRTGSGSQILPMVRLAPRNRGSVCLECNEKGGNVISLLPAVRKHEPKRR
jgi:hypothetical protein